MTMESPSFEKIEFSEESEEFKKKFRAVLEKDVGLVADRGAKFVRGTLWKAHSVEDLHNYEAYCVLISSTPLKQPEHFDLEGDESIVRFIDGIAEEVESKKK